MEKDGPCWRLESGSLDNLRLRAGEGRASFVRKKNDSCWTTEEMTMVPAFPIPCSLSGKFLQYSIPGGKCGCKLCRGDQQEHCWITPGLEPIIPKGSGVGLVIWETICWCREGACVVCIPERQFLSDKGTRFVSLLLLFYQETQNRKDQLYTKPTCPGTPYKVVFPPDVHFYVEKKIYYIL